MLALQYAKKLFAGHLPVANIHIVIIRIVSINCVVTVMVSKMGL